MKDIALGLIVVAFTLIIILGIFWLSRRKQLHNREVIAQMAAERGWKFETINEPLAWGLRLYSTRWTIESLSRSSGRESGPGSSDVSMNTNWRSPATGSAVLLGPRASQSSSGRLGDALARQIMGLALGSEASGLVEVQAGSDALRQKYMLWAKDPAEAERLLGPALESALLNWKGTLPLIQRSSSGLSIDLRGTRLQTPTEINALVQLGEIILAWQMDGQIG